MRSMQPVPIVPRWLLQHFGSSPNNEVILGDLDERYQEGHSHLWYWRQSLNAITTGFSLQVRTHKWLAARAVIIGWICGFLIMPLIQGYVFVFLKHETFSGYDPRNWWTLGGSVIQYYDWWFVLIAPLALSLLGGRVVALTHQRLRRAMVLAFFVSRCAIAVPLIFFFLVGMFIEGHYLHGLIKLVFANAITLPGILIGGGLCGTPPPEASSSRRSYRAG